jgi:flagellar protein FlaF
MAVAGIIGGAIGVMLLIITAYILVNSVIYTAETVTNAQKDMTLLTEIRIGTAFTISNPSCTWEDPNYNITYGISNNGTKIISDFKHMSVIVKDSEGYYFYPYKAASTGVYYWEISKYNNDVMHPGQLDPGETFEVTLLDPDEPNWIQMTTGNGVYASKDKLGCVQHAPTLTSITPSTGPNSTPVTIVGTGFTGATAVKFGTSATTILTNTGKQITATSPDGTGTVDVTVTTPYGTSATSADSKYYYT